MNDRFRQLQIVCGAILAGLVMVNGVLAVLLSTGSLQPAPVPASLPLVLCGIALVLLVSSGAVKAAVSKRADAEGFDGDPGKASAAYQTANLVAFALREAGGLIGFVLALLTANPWWSWGLGAAAAIAMILDWPKRERLKL